MKKLFFTLTLLTIFSNILFAQSYDDVYSNSNSEWNASKYDYVDDYVDNQNDDSYFYASRIRRFYRPMRSCGYYSNFYRDPYWWDCSYSYPSWYMTIPSLNFSWNNWA